jgi:hypothetical protein
MARKKKEIKMETNDATTNGEAAVAEVAVALPDIERPPPALPVEAPVPAALPQELQPVTAGTHDPHPTNGSNLPAFKVGPIATDKDNSVEAAVWGRVITTRDGREFTVYSVTVQANWRDSDGSWKKSGSFRGSQCYALVYCIQRCSDWILAQRGLQQAPF